MTPQPAKFKNKISSIQKFRTLVAVLLLLPIGFSTPALASSHQQIPMIQVSATGTTQLAPDTAILNLGVLREAKTARQALDENNIAMKSVIDVLKLTGIAEKDLQTANFNIQPRYKRYNRNTPEANKAPQIIGYVVSNSLTVKVRDLNILGTVLDKVVTLGVNSGGGVRFTNDDPSEAITRARVKAMQNAIAAARTLTGAANTELGEILLISENVNSRGPVPLAMARTFASDSAESSVPLAAGENTYRVTVNVSWKIGTP